ncbi:MAG: SHOCT domain-containing protein [Dehalococcoidia bacterium]|nr:SHOCT domain-containing protein [Dehalococcoidia bacterium]
MIMRRRRVGLAGAAVATGGAFALGRRAANQAAAEREQEARLQALEASAAAPPMPAAAPPAAPPAAPAAAAPAAPAAAAPPEPDRLAELKDLTALRDAGALTDAEFEAEKQRILGG